jgi:hypothetical protein
MQRTIQTGIWSFERLSFVQLCKTVVLSEKQEKLPNVEAQRYKCQCRTRWCHKTVHGHQTLPSSVAHAFLAMNDVMTLY